MIIEPSRVLAFWLANVAICITPGPDTMYVLARSIGQGKKTGLVSAAAILTGVTCHLAMGALGLAALLQASPMAFTVIKLAGAIYLGYLGVKLLFSKAQLEAAEQEKDSVGRIYRQGVLTNLLNPKAILFTFAFLPQFIDPNRGTFLAQYSVLGIVMLCTDWVYLATVAVLAGRIGDWLESSPKFQRAQKKVLGTFFVWIAAKLALSSKS